MCVVRETSVSLESVRHYGKNFRACEAVQQLLLNHLNKFSSLNSIPLIKSFRGNPVKFMYQIYFREFFVGKIKGFYIPRRFFSESNFKTF